eukprot:scaffold130654_cov31-Tisochrysis_lutea.AAC.2
MQPPPPSPPTPPHPTVAVRHLCLSLGLSRQMWRKYPPFHLTRLQARLTHPMLLLLPATIACSFAFMLPAANASNSVVFATQRLSITDFIGTGGLLTLACVVIGSPVIYYMVRNPTVTLPTTWLAWQSRPNAGGETGALAHSLLYSHR